MQEGDEPCDNVEELYKELDEALVQLEDLIYRINLTNVQTIHDGESLTRLMAKKDVLAMLSFLLFLGISRKYSLDF